jgi:flavin-dependent dehydrogenase
MQKTLSDVLIIGGGPAGLATALALRQRGASVSVADAMKPPIDKACGEGLMPDSLRDLVRLGVHLSPEDGAAFHGIRFINHASAQLRDTATAPFAAGRTPDECSGIGLKRQALHTQLVKQTEAAGVDLRWQSPVQLQAAGKVAVAGESLVYGLLIGADGQSSRVRRWAGLEKGSIVSQRFGFRQHFQVEPWSPFVEVHWSRSGQAYVTPVGPNEVCVATVARDPTCRLARVLEEMPQLREKLRARGLPPQEQAATDRERGAVTTTRRLANVVLGRIALVGDAAGSADAITGEGMGMAFRQALLLAECAAAGDLARYNSQHPHTLRLPQAMARIMLMMDRSPAFRDRAIRMLAAQPEMFARMLGVHLGEESIAHFMATRGVEVLWRLAIPQRSAATQSALSA